MNELTETIKIKGLIYEICGKQVILDSDVAALFQYETSELNRNVKNNIERFPEDYSFQLTKKEYDSLICKNPISKKGRGGRRHLPYVFTEHGIVMLAGILKNKIAVDMSIKIVNAFIEMRILIRNTSHIINRISSIECLVLEHNKKIDEIFDMLRIEEVFKQKIFYDGQYYDAYSIIIDIIKTAKNNIVIIDNYVDKSTLDILSQKNKNVDVIIAGKNNLKLKQINIDKFNRQYPKLNLIIEDKFHDRFIIIDNQNVYHIGSSLKDVGKKCFMISKGEDFKWFPYSEFVKKTEY